MWPQNELLGNWILFITLFFSLANIFILHERFVSQHDNQEGSSHVFTPYISKESNESRECELNKQKVYETWCQWAW
jgi:hypothetical protein